MSSTMLIISGVTIVASISTILTLPSWPSPGRLNVAPAPRLLPFAQSVVDTMIKPEPLANASSLSEAALLRRGAAVVGRKTCATADSVASAAHAQQ